jgi:hypothetical protein
VVEASQRLLPWLSQVGCEQGLDPIEQELLATPLGHLSDSQRIDANWAGEAATYFCWMLKLTGPLEEASPADQSRLPVVLSILKPSAAEILRSASLRERSEIQDASCQFVLIRSMLQETRVAMPARSIIRRVGLEKLSQIGLAATEDAVKRASDTVNRMTPQERSRAAGFYFIREHAALWFFSDHPNYFASTAHRG